jgi:uncharacterized protein
LQESITVDRHGIRVFLDTNVIFSGLYSPKGTPGLILEYFIRGHIEIVISQQILEELIQTLKEKLPEALPAMKMLLINTPPEICVDPSAETLKPWVKIIHPADAAILAAVIAAKPDYFVTGDSHFLENRTIQEKSGLKIITPAQFFLLLNRAKG